MKLGLCKLIWDLARLATGADLNPMIARCYEAGLCEMNLFLN